MNANIERSRVYSRRFLVFFISILILFAAGLLASYCGTFYDISSNMGSTSGRCAFECRKDSFYLTFYDHYDITDREKLRVQFFGQVANDIIHEGEYYHMTSTYMTRNIDPFVKFWSMYSDPYRVRSGHLNDFDYFYDTPAQEAVFSCYGHIVKITNNGTAVVCNGIKIEINKNVPLTITLLDNGEIKVCPTSSFKSPWVVF
jgi:hypothetical protein